MNKKNTCDLQKLYTSVIESSDDAIYSKSLEGIITSWNQGAEYIFGYTAKEAIGKSIKLLIPKDRKSEFIFISNKIKKGEAVERFETQRLAKNGQLIDVSETISPLKNNSGKIIGAFATARNITDRKSIASELEIERLRWKGVVEGMADEVWICDKQAKISLMNRKAASIKVFKKFTDLTVEEIMEEVEIFTPDGLLRPNEQNPLLRSLKGEIVRGEEILRHRKTGKRYYRQFTSSPIQDAQGKITGAVAVVRDITERRQLEEALKENEKRYKILTETSPDCIKLFDKEGNLLYMNKAGLHEHRLDSRDELKTWDFYKCIVPEDHNKIKSAFIEALSGKENTLELRHTQDGSLRENCLLTLSPVINDKNEVECVFGVSRDISDLKKTETALRDSEMRFRLMADGSPMIIWVTDPDGHLQFANKTYRDFFGVTFEQVKANRWQIVVHPEDALHYAEQFNQALKDHKPFIAEARVRRFDGKWRWIASHAVPRFSPHGKLLGYIGISPDITERKKLEQQKDEFLSIASHELKTPVTSIKAYGQILQKISKQKSNIDTQEILSKLDYQVNKLTELVNDLLDVTRIQAGKIQFHNEFFDFNDLVNEIVKDMQITSNRHKIIKRLSASRTVYGDRNHIGQVLINLLSNAIKYSPSADTIIVSSITEDSCITLSVKDYGIGIPEESQQKIFDRFYRVNSIKENQVTGLGLGLYISSEIIKRQNGKIWVESKKGRGSTFSFKIPIQQRDGQKRIVRKILRNSKSA